MPIFLPIFYKGQSITLSNPLSLHDSLPIYAEPRRPGFLGAQRALTHVGDLHQLLALEPGVVAHALRAIGAVLGTRSEEHTSELQSRRDIVCRLLLEKKYYPFIRRGRELCYV